MGAADEEWVKAAMTDDMMVVELLLRLHRAPRRQPPLKPVPAALPLEWSVRQRRSKSVSVNNHPKKPAHRASPTTPLSWSGATSFSGGSAGAGGVGSEESSRPIPLKLSNTARSKNLDIYCHARGKASDSAIGSGLACFSHSITFPQFPFTSRNDHNTLPLCMNPTIQSQDIPVTSTDLIPAHGFAKTMSRNPYLWGTVWCGLRFVVGDLGRTQGRRKLAVEERIDLKRRMAVLRMNLERQRATNENLKRMKIELQPHLNRESTSAAEESTSGQPQQDLTTVVMPPVASINDGSLQPSTSNARPNENAEAASDSKFFLPDLNIPFDEPSPDVVCGVS
ncbi:UNVERIFIED_CONTAM: hypothetical protein Sangu_2065600 [Sesamum angustifolium]|uniref:Uncharacterized protein n=1 Tax=Sesamum angustifolium TaxID=2727405 RepID=A0AAW2LJ23_9LAMI